MAYERNAGGSGTSNPVNSGGKIGGVAITLSQKKKDTEPRKTGLTSTSEISNPVNSGSFSKSKDRAAEAATPSYDDWERQEQERLLAEERKRKQEYEAEQNALKAEQWVEQHNKPAVEEPVVEQPSAGYMPYGDPRKKPNPVSYYTPEEQQSNDVVANTTSALEVPVYTPAQQNRNNLKAGAKTSANKAEDETEFYTRTPETDIDVTNPLAYKPQGFAETLLNIGVKPAVAEKYYDPNTGKTYYDSLIEAIQGKPAYDWSNVTVTSTTTPRREGELRAEANMLPYNPPSDMLFPYDSGGTTVERPLEGTGRPAITNDLPSILDVTQNGIPADIQASMAEKDEKNSNPFKLNSVPDADKTLAFLEETWPLLKTTTPQKTRTELLAEAGANGLTGTQAQEYVDAMLAKQAEEQMTNEDIAQQMVDLTQSWNNVDNVASLPFRIAGAAAKAFGENYQNSMNNLELNPAIITTPNPLTQQDANDASYEMRVRQYEQELANKNKATATPEETNPLRSYEAMARQYDTLQSEVAKDLLLAGVNPDYTRISDYVYNQLPDQMTEGQKAQYVLGLTDETGKTHFDEAAARQGYLPDNLSVPYYADYGNGKIVTNEAYDKMTEMNYFDSNGMTLFKDENGNYIQPVPQADGSIKYEKYKGEVTAEPKHDWQDILSLYVNPRAGQQGESTWRGLDAVFEGLTPEERKGMEELLASFVRGGDLDAETTFGTEFANMTEAEYEKFVQMFLSKMPALQNLIDTGVVNRTDLENFFFKNLKDGSGNGTRTGSGSGSGYGYGGYYRGYGGGGYYSPYYRGGSSGSSYYTPNRVSGGSATPSTTNQRQSRIYNIMKNWSF